MPFLKLMSSLFDKSTEPLYVKSTRLRVVMALQETLSDYVRRVISEKGLNYREVSRRSGGVISHATVGDIVNGVSKDVRTATLSALARGLGVSEDEIFAIARGKKLEPMSPKDFYSALEALGVEQFHAYGGVANLTAEDQQEIIAMIEAMIEQKLKRKQSAQKSQGARRK
jgi:transcriptional regulator with XRE-family HTH domain